MPTEILVVDDDPVARKVLVEILSNQPDCAVTIAEDGDEAWQLLEDSERFFNVVFLDLTMPEVDGFELLKRMRSSAVLKSTEIVVCTAARDVASFRRATEFGVRHYVVKPCSVASVLAKLSQIQGAGESRSPASAA